MSFNKSVAYLRVGRIQKKTRPRLLWNGIFLNFQLHTYFFFFCNLGIYLPGPYSNLFLWIWPCINQTRYHLKFWMYIIHIYLTKFMGEIYCQILGRVGFLFLYFSRLEPNVISELLLHLSFHQHLAMHSAQCGSICIKKICSILWATF